MRVTNLTKKIDVLRNMNKNEANMQRLQENLSSGRRINSMSEDPVSAILSQDFRTQISFLNSLKSNIEYDFIWMDRTENELKNIADILKRTKVLVLSQANGTENEQTRRVAAEEIKAMIQSLINSGNANIGKLNIFSGSLTFTEPLVEMPAIVDADFRYVPTHELNPEVPKDRVLLDYPRQWTPLNSIQFDGYTNHEYVVKIVEGGELGRARFKVSADGGKSWGDEHALVNNAKVINPDDPHVDKVFLRISDATQAFDEGMEFRFKPNPPVIYAGNNQKRNIETSEGELLPINVTGQEVFFANPDKPETIDIFNLMFRVHRAMVDNDQDTLMHSVGDMDFAFEQVLLPRADQGSVRRELETRLEKLGQREFSKTEQLSNVEDLDIAETSVKMNLAEAQQKAGLDSAARLLQPTLLNFIK